MWSCCFFFCVEFSWENSGWWENGIENKGVMMITVSGDKIKVAESDKDGDFGEKQLWELKDTRKSESERDTTTTEKLHIFGVKLNFDMRGRGENLMLQYTLLNLGYWRVGSGFRFTVANALIAEGEVDASTLR